MLYTDIVPWLCKSAASMRHRFFVVENTGAGVAGSPLVEDVVRLLAKSGGAITRTRGSVVWASFYGLFVVAAAIHASIGVRNVLTEWSPLRDRGAGWCATAFGILLVALGLRAVLVAVFLAMVN